jgi:hypothetical protein
MPPKQKEVDGKERMHEITIHAQEGFEGKDDVKVGVNGKVYQIKRGFKVQIPESVLRNLEDCKYTIVSRDDQGNEDIREVPRFSYTYHGVVQEPEPEDPEEPEDSEEEEPPRTATPVKRTTAKKKKKSKAGAKKKAATKAPEQTTGDQEKVNDG